MDAVRQVIERHFPDRRTHPVRPLGAGLENAAFEVGGDLVVRFRTDADEAHEIEREGRLLRWVAGRSPLPVPVPLLALAEEGCLVYGKLPGRPLIDWPASQRGQWAGSVGATLGGFLAALHSTPHDDVGDLVPVDDTGPTEWLDEVRQLADEIPARHRTAVCRFLAARPPDPTDRLTFSHNDLGIEHVLVDPRVGRVTGILDWSDAAVCDPARDFGLVLRDLGPDALGSALASYGDLPSDVPRLQRRIGFLARCALLEDFAHGLQSDAEPYVAKSLRGMEWLFAP